MPGGGILRLPVTGTQDGEGGLGPQGQECADRQSQHGKALAHQLSPPERVRCQEGGIGISRAYLKVRLRLIRHLPLRCRQWSIGYRESLRAHLKPLERQGRGGLSLSLHRSLLRDHQLSEPRFEAPLQQGVAQFGVDVERGGR